MIENHINTLRIKYNGLDAGEMPALNGYLFTFASCYLRDFQRNFNIITDALETSSTWSNAL